MLQAQNFLHEKINSFLCLCWEISVFFLKWRKISFSVNLFSVRKILSLFQWLKDVIPFGQENILNTLHTDDNVHFMIQRINKNQQNFNYAILMAILMYALSILSYLQNRHLYSVETIFHEDMLEKPIQTIQVSYQTKSRVKSYPRIIDKQCLYQGIQVIFRHQGIKVL